MFTGPPKSINNERAIESREQRRERYASKIKGPKTRRLEITEITRTALKVA